MFPCRGLTNFALGDLLDQPAQLFQGMLDMTSCDVTAEALAPLKMAEGGCWWRVTTSSAKPELECKLECKRKGSAFGTL